MLCGRIREEIHSKAVTASLEAVGAGDPELPSTGSSRIATGGDTIEPALANVPRLPPSLQKARPDRFDQRHRVMPPQRFALDVSYTLFEVLYVRASLQAGDKSASQHTSQLGPRCHRPPLRVPHNVKGVIILPVEDCGVDPIPTDLHPDSKTRSMGSENVFLYSIS